MFVTETLYMYMYMHVYVHVHLHVQYITYTVANNSIGLQCACV